MGLDVPAAMLWHALLYAISYKAFTLIVLREQDVNLYVKVLFAVNMTACCSMMSLMVAELGSVMESSSRKWIWWLDITILCISLVLLNPAFLFYSFARRKFSKPRVVRGMTLLFLCIYLLMFWRLGIIFPVTTHSNATLTSQCVGRIGILGVFFVAVLAGFGSIATPYNYLSIFAKPISASHLAQNENYMQQTVDILFVKKRKLKEFEAKARRQGIDRSKRRNSGFFSFFRMKSMWTSESDVSSAVLRQEIAAMEGLVHELYLEIHEMRSAQRRAEKAVTIKGRFFNLLGHVLSVYGVYKFLMAIVNVLLRRDKKRDPVTVALERFCYWTGYHFDVEFLSRYVSFVFVGVLVFSNTRGFLLRLMHIFSATAAVGYDQIGVLISWLMGLYLLSTVLLMRMNMPEPYRQVVTEAMGDDVKFSVFYRWSDEIFALSAIGSLVLFYAVNRFKSSRTGGIKIQ